MLLLLYSNISVNAGALVPGNVVDTVTYSQHPVNCIMDGNVPFKGRETEWDIPAGGIKETATAIKTPTRRLSKSAPSFTTITKRGDRIN